MSETLVVIARRLHRRHCIDRVEMNRMTLAQRQREGTAIGFNSYSRVKHELTETDVESSWSADGKERAYWILMAREILGYCEGAAPAALPEPMR